MTRENRRTLFITTILCILIWMGYYAFCALLRDAGGLSQKFRIPIWFYAAVILVNIALNAGLSLRICRKNGARMLVSLGKWISPVTALYFSLLSVYAGLYPASSAYDSGIVLFVGFVFIISGNYFPKNHVNPYIGLKFPWLLHDEESWDKTHKLGGYTWILAGLVLILQVFFHSLKTAAIPLVIILAGILPLVYSLMLVYKKKS